jgi:S-methylmethionine-dependent homocysteine/selenocysteine methylase
MRLIDGGLSTELERIGAQFQGELWTGQALINNPELVEEAHRNFVTSDACLLTCSRAFVLLFLTEAANDEFFILSSRIITRSQRYVNAEDTGNTPCVHLGC